MWSEHFWDTTINIYSKAMNVSKELLINTVLPQISNANAENYVIAMDEAGIDNGLVMGVDYGLSTAVKPSGLWKK